MSPKDIKLTELLGSHIYERKRETIERVLANRTRHLTVVFEDIYYNDNVSAALRTSEICGLQEVHIIENRNAFNLIEGVARAANKWMDLHRYNSNTDNSLSCINALKDRGYKIIATAPNEGSANLEDFDLSNKTAIVMGNEVRGVSPTIMENADGYIKIPMVGFTESYNISVATALIIYQLSHKLRLSQEINWQLSEEEKFEKRLEWYKKTIKSGRHLFEYYKEKIANNQL